MKKLLLILPLIMLGFTQCDSIDFGDTNTDDDAVIDADVSGLMAAAMNRYFTLTGREYTARPTLYVQYQSQAVYTDEQRYNEAPSTWSGYYVQTLSNLNEVVEYNENLDESEIGQITQVYGAPANQIAVAELMSAYIWKQVTDSFGPIPYESALNDEVLTPEYTDQETIYTDLITRVKTARDLIDVSLPGPAGDVVYGGEMENWQKFANSFLLTLTMQLSKVYPNPGEFAATEFSSALDNPLGVIEDISEEMWYSHQNTQGAVNPFSSFRGGDYDLSEPFVDALSGVAPTTGTIEYSNTIEDNRLAMVFADDDALEGRPYGVSNDGSGTFAKMSPLVKSPDSPMPYMTAAYTYLNRAEAAELGWTAEDPVLMLTDGINASYESLDFYYLDDADSLATTSDAYTLARVADALTVGNLQVIREEKWVALFPNGHMAWAEWRRTGVPGLTPAPDYLNAGEIPRRYIYPSDEAGVNAVNYSDAVSNLSGGVDNNTARFWWDI